MKRFLMTVAVAIAMVAGYVELIGLLASMISK